MIDQDEAPQTVGEDFAAKLRSILTVSDGLIRIKEEASGYEFMKKNGLTPEDLSIFKDIVDIINEFIPATSGHYVEVYSLALGYFNQFVGNVNQDLVNLNNNMNLVKRLAEKNA